MCEHMTESRKKNVYILFPESIFLKTLLNWDD